MSIFDRIKGLFGGTTPNGGAASNGSGGAMGDMSDMISCDDALRLVHEFLDGELDDAPAGRVKQHFDMCERCYPHLHLERAYRDTVRRAASGEAAPDALKAKVAALIAEAEAEG